MSLNVYLNNIVLTRKYIDVEDLSIFTIQKGDNRRNKKY